MPKSPKFEPVLTDDGWMVSVPAAMSGSGKRERKFFGTDDTAAKKFGQSLRGSYARGERGGIISHALALEAAAASKLLAGTGITLLQAATAAAEAAKKTAASSETFRQRYTRVVPLGEAQWSQIYTDDMGRLPRWVGSEFMERDCALITQDAVHAALRANGAKALSTVEHRTRYVMAILNFKERHRRNREIAIMSLQQVRAMLRAAENPTERRVAALLVFAGVRPHETQGEITRLEWDAFDGKEIYISKFVSKTNSDRIIPLTPRLKRLLRGHPSSGPVIPPNWRRVYKRLRKAAELGVEQDITRHTFASHYLAAFGEDKTKAAMGHTANSRTLFQHYRRAINEAAGVKFFR